MWGPKINIKIQNKIYGPTDIFGSWRGMAIQVDASSKKIKWNLCWQFVTCDAMSRLVIGKIFKEGGMCMFSSSPRLWNNENLK